MKLHLGCGQVYLEGYLNIDYESDKHTIQNTSVADKFADITKLKYSKNSIEEVRLHHVFEHFSRAQAIGLLLSWVSWLQIGGKLTIEVPDFERMTRIYLSPFSTNHQKSLALRHIFGSQEAFWAIHFHGWTKKELIEIAQFAGLEPIVSKSSSNKNIYNVLLVATKRKNITQTKANKVAKDYLSKYMVDQSITEKRMLKEWLGIYLKQMHKSWGR